jgi:hypothetical protein
MTAYFRHLPFTLTGNSNSYWFWFEARWRDRAVFQYCATQRGRFSENKNETKSINERQEETKEHGPTVNLTP